ncbi:thiamine diphosphokinase [Neobacillus sp. LXY-1]|uniref:thiamine diphosphokinase n=1 Tax=Neobacillus sp. LXY-1 TaxID=3379133 RepID=UPI003EE1D1C2
MIIHILAGGPEDHLPDLRLYNEADVVWVGVDRGVFHLLNRGIHPKLAFGDFDSVSKQELTYIENNVGEMQRFKPEKNETDLELALNWAMNQHPKIIRIFGATGGRLDHLLANVQLMIHSLREQSNTEIYLIDRYNIAYLKEPGTHNIKKMDSAKYISFVPLTLAVSDLTLEGFKYPLKNRYITLGSTLCISNELISDYGTFSFSEGILIVIRSHD